MITLFFLILCPCYGASQDHIKHKYSIDEIRQEALGWVTNEISSQYDSFNLILLPVDKKTATIWTCEHPLSFSLPQNTLSSSRLSVLAQCHRPRWSLVIGLSQEIFDEVATLSESLNYGQVLDYEHILWKKKNILLLNREYYTSQTIDQLLGMEARRNLAAGDILQRNSFKVFDIIKKNQLIDIVFKREGLLVTAQGRALEKGHIGKSIIVENIDSRTKLQATIVNENTVEVR